MKKLLFITVISVLTAILAVPQNASAKDKKVIFLGHHYKGAVDKNKVPAGYGGMNVNGLVIWGMFDNHSATDAEVHRVSTLGTSSTTFVGNVTYDESDNIILKAGGVISTKFYYSNGNKDNHSNLENRDPGTITDTLKQDRVVNSSNFERESITFYYTVENHSGYLWRIRSELDIPTFMVPYTAGLTKVNRYKGEDVDMDVFVNYTNHDGENVKVSDYRDNIGRIWNFSRVGKQDNLAVKYPDGSKLSCSIQSDGVKNSQWECHLPDGKVVTFEDDGKIAILDLGKIQIKGKGGIYNYIWRFGEAKKDGKFSFIPSDFEGSNDIHISSNTIDLTKSTNKEIEELIAHEVEPFVSCNWVHVCDNMGSELGVWYKNKYESKEQAAAAKAKRDTEKAAVINKSIAGFKKKYGFDPSINNVRSIVKVGRSVFGVINARNEWIDEYAEGADRNQTIKVRLVRDQGTSKCYEFFSVAGAFYCGYFWTRNDVITSIYWGPKRFR